MCKTFWSTRFGNINILANLIIETENVNNCLCRVVYFHIEDFCSSPFLVVHHFISQDCILCHPEPHPSEAKMDFEGQQGYGSCSHVNPTIDQSSKARNHSIVARDRLASMAESSLMVSGSVFSGHGLGTGAGSINQKCLAKSQSTFTRRQLLVILCFAYGNFWIAACVSLQAPFFPAEAERKGASATIYGAIFGVYELMIITCSPLFSKLIQWVSPNFMVESGLLVCGVSTILFGLVFTQILIHQLNSYH